MDYRSWCRGSQACKKPAFEIELQIMRNAVFWHLSFGAVVANVCFEPILTDAAHRKNVRNSDGII